MGSEAMAGVPPDPARLARAAGRGLGRRVSVEVERTVDAPMERVWALLRDYRVARRRPSLRRTAPADGVPLAARPGPPADRATAPAVDARRRSHPPTPGSARYVGDP